MKFGFWVLAFTLSSTSAWALPKRLVLALDGVGYSDVHALQQEGYFSNFNPVSRSIATYPSLSDVCWADIFRTYRPLGYQRYHYSVEANRIIGGALSDLGNPIEYEKRMHLAFESKIHHGLSYMFPLREGKKEIRKVVQGLLNSKEEGTFYAYMLSTDTLQHTNGDIKVLLKHIQAELNALQAEYQKRAHRPLEIAIVSDHGNNKQNHGVRVPFKERLAEKGFQVTEKIRADNDVVFTSAGILTSVSIFARSSQLKSLSSILLGMVGVDLVTSVSLTDRFSISVQNSKGESAWIQKKPDFLSYAYAPEQGDPLSYLSVIEKMAFDGKIDAEGFATAEDWLSYTAEHYYPVAPERIYRGHYLVAGNVAPMIVSLKQGYENANEAVKRLSELKGRGGTHGALSIADSSGILMTNYIATSHTTTNHVADILDFSDLPDYRDRIPGVELIDSQIVGYDLKTGAPIEEDDPLGPEHAVFFNIWDPSAAEFLKMGISTQYEVTVKKDGFSFFNPKVPVLQKVFYAETLPRTPNFTEFRIPVSTVLGQLEAEQDYFTRINARRMDLRTGRLLQKERIAKHQFTTDSDGHAIAY